MVTGTANQFEDMSKGETGMWKNILAFAIVVSIMLYALKSWMDIPVVAFSNSTGKPVYVINPETNQKEPVTQKVLSERYERVMVD